jgi:hypothetical protein
MSAPTVNVTLTAADQNGNPVSGARVTAQLDQTEIYNGFIVPERVEGVSDANGVCVLALWPNELGVAGSVYRIQSWNPDTGKKFLDGTASVPNSDCNLHEIILQEPYPTIDAAQQALIAAQSAVGLVTEQVQSATVSATTATTKASEAALSATAALASENAAGASESNAGTQSTAASTSATSAANSASTATNAATSATGSATSAGTNASTATTQAGLASTRATAALASQNAADTSATSASTSATSAGSSATTATTQAGNSSTRATAALASQNAAATSATSASGSATTATTKASEASTSASAASGSASGAATSAGTATTQAGVATTKASEAAGSATAASTSASQSLTSANNSATSATGSEGSATAALASQGAASTSASTATTQAATATTQANAATTQANASLASSTLAEAWAIQLTDPVASGEYSAKYWAQQAAASTTGQLVYRGSWSASSGVYPASPALGDYYKVSATGTTGGTDYNTNDSIIYNGTSWDKIDSTDQVSSVAGRVGAVVLDKSDVGLGNADNTSDANKPISSATATALSGKQASGTYASGTGSASGTNTGDQTASSLGLGNVNNTSDANKPVSTAQAAADTAVQNAAASDATSKANARGDVFTTSVQTLTNKTFTGFTETVYSLSGTTPALSVANGTVQTWTLSANSNPTDSLATGQSLTLLIDDGATYTVTWPTVTWKTNAGEAPTLNTESYTVVVLWKVASVLYGARVGDA